MSTAAIKNELVAIGHHINRLDSKSDLHNVAIVIRELVGAVTKLAQRVEELENK